MGLSIIPIGGYGEVGRNCTAVEVDGDFFVLDLGLHLDNFVRVSEDDDLNGRIGKRLLIREGAIPDISVIDKERVKAILISHAHLDHVGAVPFLANSFPCDLHGTPFTMEIARRQCEDKRTHLKHDLVSHGYREVFPITDKVSAEFVEVTHSTPQSSAIVLHTPYGAVVYLNDFKLDDAPTIGNPTDLDRLSSLDVKALIIDTLYADLDAHTESESFAHGLLENALLSRDLSDKNIIVSSFSSHVARLEALARIGDRMGRKVMFLGRSMVKYLEAAKEVGVSDLISRYESVRYGSKVRKALSLVHRPGEYLFVATGGMAEPKAVLSRIVSEEYLPLKRGDLIVFSNRTIPTPTIIAARERLEQRLQGKGFELLKDLHVSGHGAARDHAVVLDRLRPEFVVPVHGEDKQREAFVRVAEGCGFSVDNILVLADGERKDVC